MSDQQRGLRRVAVAAGVLAAAGVGWWAVAHSPVPLVPGPELDLMDDYSSLDELLAEATDVVLVEPTGESRVETIAGAEFLVAEAEVVASGTGPLSAGDLVEIRQEGEHYRNVAPHLEEGARYVVYLVPFRFTDEEETGQHWVVSSQAVWRVGGTTGRLTTQKSSLPRTLEVSGSGDELVVSD